MVALTLTLTAVLSIIFGILILIWPRFLNYFVALWLIIIGILGLFGDKLL
ncbi:MAG: DUF3096 domain-containing protein [Nanoarchaeota archaeon]